MPSGTALEMLSGNTGKGVGMEKKKNHIIKKVGGAYTKFLRGAVKSQRA